MSCPLNNPNRKNDLFSPASGDAATIIKSMARLLLVKKAKYGVTFLGNAMNDFMFSSDAV